MGTNIGFVARSMRGWIAGKLLQGGGGLYRGLMIFDHCIQEILVRFPGSDDRVE